MSCARCLVVIIRLLLTPTLPLILASLPQLSVSVLERRPRESCTNASHSNGIAPRARGITTAIAAAVPCFTAFQTASFGRARAFVVALESRTLLAVLCFLVWGVRSFHCALQWSVAPGIRAFTAGSRTSLALTTVSRFCKWLAFQLQTSASQIPFRYFERRRRLIFPPSFL